MNFIQISLTSRCNLECRHCPMGASRNTDSAPHVLTNARLLPWISRHCDPAEWMVELTGGEPALYPELFSLVKELSDAGYHGLIKTNGILPTPESPNFVRCSAFHQYEKFPKFWDIILIVDKLDSERKIAYCKRHNIPYKVIGYNKENPDGAKHGFKKIAYIDNHGHQVPCMSCNILYEDAPDHYTIEFSGLKKGMVCGHCKAAIDAWRFIPEEWKK